PAVVRQRRIRDQPLDRLHPCPLDTKPVRRAAGTGQQLHVLPVAVVGVAGVTAAFHPGNPSFVGPEVGVRVVALDLVRRGRGSPQETLRERGGHWSSLAIVFRAAFSSRTCSAGTTWPACRSSDATVIRSSIVSIEAGISTFCATSPRAAARSATSRVTRSAPAGLALMSARVSWIEK